MEALVSLVHEYFILVVLATCFIVAIALRSLTTIVANLCRERSRREIAAYIAEGTITAEHGERLIRADVNRGPSVP